MARSFVMNRRLILCRGPFNHPFLEIKGGKK